MGTGIGGTYISGADAIKLCHDLGLEAEIRSIISISEKQNVDDDEEDQGKEKYPAN